MIRNWSLITSGLVVFAIMVLPISLFGRTDISAGISKEFRSDFSSASPAHCIAGHRIGQIVLAVNNNGTFGTGFRVQSQDCFTGEGVPSCEYPKGSNVEYLFAGAFWIGAVVGRDTMVSLGADGWSHVREFFPDELPFGKMTYRSNINPDKPEYEGAVSEEDYISVYTDTFTEGIGTDAFGRPHVPLHIEVTEASYAWSYSYAEDFVLFDYKIRNIGSKKLKDVYMGVYVDADVCFDCTGTNGYADDLCGFLRTYPTQYGTCNYTDTVNIAWIADNDGDPGAMISAPHVTATRIVRTPSDSLDVSFNWWISNSASAKDFGPRHRKNLRDLGTGGLGTPEGDVNKYHFLSNNEFDYDQAYTAVIDASDTLWLYPNQDEAPSFAKGYDTRYLLSFGPFDIRPGQTLPISFAYVAGSYLHTPGSHGNIDNLPDNPDLFYDNLSFDDLATNATWASRIYDNPGVDTDSNGYAGKFRICHSDSAIYEINTLSEDPLILDTIWEYLVSDTMFYEGDGVPDFVGASPPPAPEFWVETSVGSVRIRFNGLRSETTRDAFSYLVDFEGYNVYLGRDDRSASFGLVASYDLQNFNKYIWIRGEWELRDIPFSLEELRCLYGESCNDTTFNPLSYTRIHYYVHSDPSFPDDSLFYFEMQALNVSELGITTPIRKIYPEQPYPSTLNPNLAAPDELTDDGYLKYFEYTVEIGELLPTVPYWINVTAFDYGSPESGLSSLETSVSVNSKVVYPLSSYQEVESGNLKAFVYPNPYRIDGAYRERGFEGRIDSDRPLDRTRLLHFANLPAVCTIRIYTIDGDLVRELSHNKSSDDPTASHDTWNLITRNTQMVVSGFYYWTVEDENGNVQIGKLAILM